MKNALIISVMMHLVVGFTCYRLMNVSPVRFVPRDVYTVKLVSAADTGKPATVTASKPAQPVVQEKEPEKKPEEKPEEKEAMPLPPEKPKPKAKPKKEEKIIPSADIAKSNPSAATRSDSAGATPGPGDGGPVATGDISLDGQDFPYSYYIATMRRKVAALWDVPGTAVTQQKHCQVHFRVLRSGAIQSPYIETPSGDFLFDQAAVRAVVQASPLPPLPGGFTEDYLGVHFSFTYEPGYSYEPE
jgi:TonB family protein